MRVAIFTDIYAPFGTGGIASSIKAQKDELERLGHEVTVFCPGFNPREPHVVVVPSHKIVKINDSFVALRPPVIEEFILQKFPNFAADFDLIHVHYEASCSLAGIRLARKFGLPLVQTLHGREDMAIAINIPHPVKYLTATTLNALHRHYLPHVTKIKRDKYQAPTRARAKMWQLIVNQAEMADVVLAPSDHFARKLEHYGVLKPVKTVSNGVPDALVAEECSGCALEDGAVLKLIWNSRVSHEKRIRPVLKALTMLRRPYLLYIYGNGNELKWAKRYAKKHHLKVKFYGYVKREKIIARMKESHLAVMASYNFDTQGMTLLEAEAVGLPVIFCDPAMVEVVPSESYVLTGGPEAEDFAIALDNLPADKIASMSAEMLAHRNEVVQSVQIQNLLDIYNDVLKQHTGGTTSDKVPQRS